jgi:hypothetical protein
MATGDEPLAALAARCREAGRAEKGRIPSGFASVTGSRRTLAGDPTLSPDPDLRRLGRSGAGLRGGRPGGAWRPGDQRQLRSDAGSHRNRDRLDRMRAAARPRAAPAERGNGRGARGCPARCGASTRMGCTVFVDETIEGRCEKARRDHPLAALPQERPGAYRAEIEGSGFSPEDPIPRERGRPAPDGRLQAPQRAWRRSKRRCASTSRCGCS